MCAAAKKTANALYGVREPIQARAHRTFEKILNATVRILVEDGVDNLTTNKVAAKAGVNIATLYLYFRNKESILLYLARRFEGKRAAYVEERAHELAVGEDWRAWFADSLDAMVAFRLHESGGLAVRRALKAFPEFHEFDHESTQRAADAQVRGLMAINPDLGHDKARAIAYLCTVAATAVLDEAFRVTPYDATIIEEFKSMALPYLSANL